MPQTEREPEIWSEELAPDTDRPEDFVLPELEGPVTVRTGPPAGLGQGTEDLVDITVSKESLGIGLRYLEHRIKIETSQGKKDHAERLMGFVNQLKEWRETS